MKPSSVASDIVGTRAATCWTHWCPGTRDAEVLAQLARGRFLVMVPGADPGV